MIEIKLSERESKFLMACINLALSEELKRLSDSGKAEVYRIRQKLEGKNE